MRLDYARDRLLLRIASTMRHMSFDCSPTGKMLLCQELEAAERCFESRLNEFHEEDK